MPIHRLAAVLLLTACATPFHLRQVPLTNGGRTLPNLFMGGWDGHRLDLVDDTSIEPGITRVTDLYRALSKLSAAEYGVIQVESALLTPEVTATHSLFCPQAACVVVLDRNRAQELKDWGPALAVFELTGTGNEIVGAVWMDASAVRPPGPTVWPLFCRSATDPPQHIHPDGNAVFPARASGSGAGFALFGPSDLARQYRNEGFAAPAAKACTREPAPPPPAPVAAPPPTPAVVPDPEPQPSSTDSESSTKRRSRRHRRKKSDD